MNIHEHQAKEILREYGAPVSNGIVIKTKNDIKDKITKYLDIYINIIMIKNKVLHFIKK